MPPQDIQALATDPKICALPTKPAVVSKKQGAQSTVIPPAYVNGWERKKHAIIAGFVGLTVVYLGLLHFLKDSGEYLVVKQQYCPPGTTSGSSACSRPDLFAFQVGAGTAIVYCGIVGVFAWYGPKNVHTTIPMTPEGRLFGYSLENEGIAAAQLVFQSWDFVISLFISEHCTAIMLCHHSLAGLLSWFSLRHQFLHFYGIFFLGLSEFSSIFLLFADLSNYFPQEPGTTISFVLETLILPGFAVTFTLYRVIFWWKVSYQLWKDALHVLSTGKSDQYRPGQNYVLYTYLASNIALGLLQLYWFTIILEEAKKTLG